MIDNSPSHAFKRLTAFNKQYPESKDVYRQMQAWQLKNKPEDGVFCPSGQLYGMSPTIGAALMAGIAKNDNFAQMNERALSVHQYFWGLHVFGAWRNTLGIYKLDEDIAESVIKSAIPDETPINIFARLPEWCVYVELPKDVVTLTKNDQKASIEGFWALFDYQGQQTTLNLVINLQEDVGVSYNQLQPIMLVLDDKYTVKEAVSAAYRNLNSQVDLITQNIFMQTDYHITTALLSVLLWLCAEEPDISNMVGEPVSKEQLRQPKHQQNPKTGTFIVPSIPFIYNIGKRLGGEIRSFKDSINQSGDSRQSSPKRPHIRRGHWHGYWKGTGQNKQFDVRWQPAIFVNAN